MIAMAMLEIRGSGISGDETKMENIYGIDFNKIIFWRPSFMPDHHEAE